MKRYNSTIPLFDGKEEVSQADIPNRLHKLALNKSLKQKKWNIDFLQSVINYYQRRKYISQAQFNVILRLEKQYDENNIKQRSEFRKNFTEEMRKELVIAAKIYQNLNKINHTQYWKNFIENILKDENYIPEEETYVKFMGSKYCKGYLRNYMGSSKFKVKDVVVPVTKMKHLYRGIGLVMQVDNIYPISHARGARRIGIFVPEFLKILHVEERHLKKKSVQ